MKKHFLMVPMFLAVMLMNGCSGGGGSADAVMREMVSAMNEMAQVLETSKNAKEAKPRLEALSKKMNELKVQADKLKPSKSEEEALKKKYEPEIQKAAGRLMQATLGFAGKDPQGMMEIGEVMKSVGK